jgi:Low molecular weight phosphotyrosine protein phosphatase
VFRWLRRESGVHHQQLALRTASTRLHDHFGVETIERFPHSSYDQFAGRATIPNFLPLLAERWARQRLTAPARLEGKITDARPTVLFLCTHNAGRYQMALGYANHLAGDQGVAWSGGSEPGNEIDPSAVQAMAEVGIDITREFPNRGPTKSFRQPTLWSPWAAACLPDLPRKTLRGMGPARPRRSTCRRCPAHPRRH